MERSAFSFLGRISYSVYLLHGIVLLLLIPVHGIGLIVVAFIVTIGMSTLTYRFIELPPICFGHSLKSRTGLLQTKERGRGQVKGRASEEKPASGSCCGNLKWHCPPGATLNEMAGTAVYWGGSMTRIAVIARSVQGFLARLTASLRRQSTLRRLQREQPPCPYVFASERGGPIAAKSFHTLISRLGERSGMAFPIHPHMLRHGCGYALANRRPRYPGHPGLDGPQEYPAHGTLYGAGVGSTALICGALPAYAAGLGWKVLSYPSVKEPEVSFYGSGNVYRANGHLSIWTKCLAKEDLENTVKADLPVRSRISPLKK